MISTLEFTDALTSAGIDFITGVPDSLLKEICAQITDSFPVEKHIIATNEGSSIALAIGYYLATTRPALVYMQNSGLGNSVNPLSSLADPAVYAIPLVMLIGWRGEISDDGSQLKDEPQHKKQGECTLDQLRILGIPYEIVDGFSADIGEILKKAVSDAIERQGPVAIVVRKGTFDSYARKQPSLSNYTLLRERIIEVVAEVIPANSPVVCTTGVASRELFEIRKRNKQGHGKDFLTVGGMGHASSIAAGISNAMPDSKVVCIDGDGATLMHMGALAIAADCDNLVHILINNAAHDSVGGQPTKGDSIRFDKLAKLLGYKHSVEVDNEDDLRDVLLRYQNMTGSSLIAVRCMAGFRAALGRPDRTPIENKNEFMEFLREE